MKKHLIRLLMIFLLFNSINLYAQQQDSLQSINDTASLNDITVTSLASSFKWKDVPAPVAVLNQRQIQRLDNISLLPVLNTVAGVRMEERSPGSYRLSVRGSLLRSPFGVRNLKVYYNNIPLTDAGGNTYLNLIDISNVQNIEIIKGPSSSLYGANTGGAVLMQSTPFSNHKHVVSAALQGGSYGLFKEQVKYNYSGKNLSFNVQQVHMQSDGYRNNAAMRRDAIQSDINVDISNAVQLSALLFYTDLYYQTPGGLTKAQMDSVPTLVRPGVEAQKTAIYNKTVFTGLNLTSAFSSSFNNKTSVVIHHTDFNNPIIDKYEHRNELNSGIRTLFDFHKEYSKSSFHFINGTEYLHNHSGIYTYGNKAGNKDSLQLYDNIFVQQYYLFSQFSFSYQQRVFINAGLSLNGQQLKYKRLTDNAGDYTKQHINLFPAPRVSVLYKLDKNISVYAILARGFSTPTLDEVRPSTDEFYNLQPEEGWNKEAGFKGTLFNSALAFDASVYFFDLRRTIVQNTDSSGADYFANSGDTKQHGFEIWLNSNLIKNGNHFIHTLTLANSFAYQPYMFKNYIKGNNNYSGNQLTGVPKFNDNISLDVAFAAGFYLNSNLNIVSSVPLNDANDIDANSYQLLQIKAGWQTTFKKSTINIFAGVDNMLNQQYSLGNDLNAFGGRYFNPAAKRNYYAGVQCSFF